MSIEINGVGKRFGNFVARKVGTKKAVSFGETATDIAAETRRAGYELRQNSRRLFGLRCIGTHRVPIIRRMSKGSKDEVLPNQWTPYRYCCPRSLLSSMALHVSIWLLLSDTLCLYFGQA